MIAADIEREVERARARGWLADRSEHLQPVYALTELPPGVTTTAVVTAEPDGRTGFLVIAEGSKPSPRVLWTEVGGWSADEVTHRIRDHLRRYHATLVDLRAPVST